MEKLIELLKDGRSRSIEMLATELGTSVEIVNREIEFLEMAGVIKRIDMSARGCGGGSCSGCDSKEKGCASCMPEGGFRNMGVMWEISPTNK